MPYVFENFCSLIFSFPVLPEAYFEMCCNVLMNLLLCQLSKWRLSSKKNHHWESDLGRRGARGNLIFCAKLANYMAKWAGTLTWRVNREWFYHNSFSEFFYVTVAKSLYSNYHWLFDRKANLRTRSLILRSKTLLVEGYLQLINDHFLFG